MREEWIGLRAQIRGMIKKEARDSLRGNWPTAIVILLILTAAGTALSFFGGDLVALASGFTINFNIAGNIVGILLLAPLSLGAVSWYLSILRKQKAPIESMFCMFTRERYLSSCLTEGFYTLIRWISGLILGAFAFIASLPFLFLIFSSFGYYGRHFYWGDWEYMHPREILYILSQAAWIFGLVVLLALLILAAYFFIQVFLAKYQAVYNIKADHPEKKIGDAIRESKQVMQGHTADMAYFYLSFLGWWILCVMTLGILLLYVGPYYKASKLLYIEYFRDHPQERPQSVRPPIAPPPAPQRPEAEDDTGSDDCHAQDLGVAIMRDEQAFAAAMRQNEDAQEGKEERISVPEPRLSAEESDECYGGPNISAGETRVEDWNSVVKGMVPDKDDE